MYLITFISIAWYYSTKNQDLSNETAIILLLKKEVCSDFSLDRWQLRFTLVYMPNSVQSNCPSLIIKICKCALGTTCKSRTKTTYQGYLNEHLSSFLVFNKTKPRKKWRMMSSLETIAQKQTIWTDFSYM